MYVLYMHAHVTVIRVFPPLSYSHILLLFNI